MANTKNIPLGQTTPGIFGFWKLGKLVSKNLGAPSKKIALGERTPGKLIFVFKKFGKGCQLNLYRTSDTYSPVSPRRSIITAYNRQFVPLRVTLLVLHFRDRKAQKYDIHIVEWFIGQFSICMYQLFGLIRGSYTKSKQTKTEIRPSTFSVYPHKRSRPHIMILFNVLCENKQ
jgi:hypothetical protein